MTNNKTKTENASEIEKPIMTEAEMKKFISIVCRNQDLQGDYLFNGLLYFFNSISQVIKKNPIAAQNLMFHLKEHVFYRLMWESYYAFESQSNKAHLIFSSTEPFIYEEETEEEIKSDAVETPLTEQPAAAIVDHNLQITANKTNNELPELLEAVCQHKDCPKWLREGIWDAFNDQPIQTTFTASYWRGQFDGMIKNPMVDETKSDGLESLANQLFDLMHNPLLPARIADALGDGIVSVDDIDSPEIVLNSLKKLNETEVENV